MNESEENVQLLLNLFVERNNSLWKEPDTLEWWRKVAQNAIQLMEKGDPRVETYLALRKSNYNELSLNIYRHVIVSGIFYIFLFSFYFLQKKKKKFFLLKTIEFDKVSALLPRSIRTSPIHMYDPLPPPDSVADYKRPPKPVLFHSYDYFQNNNNNHYNN